MPQYRLLQGKHSIGTVIYKAGEVIETSHDLAKSFPGRFVLLSEEAQAAAKSETGGTGDAKKIEVAKPAKVKIKPRSAPARGVEVTSDFKVDEDLFQVYQKGRYFFVYDVTSKSTAPALNDKGLTRSKVVKFTKKYLED